MAVYQTSGGGVYRGQPVFAHVKAFDSVFSSEVFQRTSYTSDEIVYGAKFVKMYQPDKANTVTVLNLDAINTYERVSLKS